MKVRNIFSHVLALGLTIGFFASASADAQTVTQQIPSGGTTSLRPAPEGDGALQNPEFAPDVATGALDSHASGGAMVNRSIAKGKGHGESGKSGKKAKSNPELNVSFNGLNFRQQRLANNGNQFSVEPPDQGLCVGNGFVMESVNDVLRVFDTAGNALIGVTDLNTFYGYPPAINRTTFARGPFVTDPSCHFDADTQRWVQIALTLDTRRTGSFTGPNHIDIAVSQTNSPLGSWTIYRLPVQDDGTQGTPNHHCAGGPCLGDYPHIGADANGFYITTNEFPFFAGGFHGAQVYAISKKALTSGSPSIAVTQFDTANFPLVPDGTPGFTVWPAVSPGDDEGESGGTEYFLSSQAVFNDSGTDNRIRIWALTNTQSLSSPSPALNLVHGVVNVDPYGVPPPSDQKAGDFPLGQCINDTTASTPFGPGCWQFLFFPPGPAHNEVEGPLDSNDSRMQQVYFANGKLWGALDTIVNIGGADKAGIAFYILKPHASSGSVDAKVDMQGTLGLANNNLTYPAIAATQSGRGVIAFTLVGADHYPSAAYVGVDTKIGAGDIHLAAEGLGPQDGFTEYKAFGNPPRPRWGDYGAAVVDDKSIWLASEYIGQTCTLAQYMSAPFGSCGGTRTSLGNWGTRISQVTP